MAWVRGANGCCSAAIIVGASVIYSGLSSAQAVLPELMVIVIVIYLTREGKREARLKCRMDRSCQRELETTLDQNNV